ncbi:MAG TPA: hypothetical protein VGH79_11285 [Gaiellaceae bacterium]|jgi:hypothetical protein
MASDSIALLARIAPISDEDAAAVFGELGRERLLEAIVHAAPARTRRLRRPLVLAVAALVVLAATGAAWALTRGSARETTAIDCKIGGGTTVIDATSGDPAADCAAIWPAPVPKLQAYSNGLGGVAVIPASEKPPAGWTPIASQDVALIELQETLDDNINGLDSSCFDSAAATTFAQQQLNRLGFSGWSTDVRSGDGACYSGFADPTSKTVTLMPSGNQAGPANWPPHQLAVSLRPLTSRCLTLSAMKSEVVERATALGMSRTVENDHNYALSATTDNTMRCATVYETVGGTIDVVVRGPAAA